MAGDGAIGIQNDEPLVKQCRNRTITLEAIAADMLATELAEHGLYTADNHTQTRSDRIGYSL